MCPAFSGEIRVNISIDWCVLEAIIYSAYRLPQIERLPVDLCKVEQMSGLSGLQYSG